MRIPILMYHHVTPHPPAAFRKYAVTPKMFAAQMRWLALTGYRAIPLDSLIAYRAGQLRLPARAAIITFDDGFRDCVGYAVPILRRYGFTAVFYLVAGLVGRSSAWLAERGLDLPLMDWPAARRLEAEGFSCASHTMTHPHLNELPRHACRAELYDSRAMLEDQLGHPVCDLAYPFGAVSPTVRAIAAETGYRSACSTRIGPSDLADDALMLQRIPVNGGESLLDFICRLYTARSYGELRGDMASGIRRRLRLQGRQSTP